MDSENNNHSGTLINNGTKSEKQIEQWRETEASITRSIINTKNAKKSSSKTVSFMKQIFRGILEVVKQEFRGNLKGASE